MDFFTFREHLDQQLDELSPGLLDRAREKAHKKGSFHHDQASKRRSHERKIEGDRAFVMGKRKAHHDSNERKMKKQDRLGDKRYDQARKFRDAAHKKIMAK